MEPDFESPTAELLQAAAAIERFTVYDHEILVASVWRLLGEILIERGGTYRPLIGPERLAPAAPIVGVSLLREMALSN